MEKYLTKVNIYLNIINRKIIILSKYIMNKISPKFFTYLLFFMLGLAFIFPLTHSTYEGFKEGKKNMDEQDEEDVEDVEDDEEDEGFREGIKKKTNTLIRFC